MKRYLNILYTTVILFALTSCAIQVGPQGGPKDTLPPLILKEAPLNKTTNFDKERITLLFNEYIMLNDPGKEMIISPLINPMPETSIKKKSVIVKFKEKLKENTTYTIQFGKSISDITEKNLLPDYTYIFSTGPKLDSLEIEGKAMDLLTNTYKENIKILLHQKGSDSSIYKSKPEYYTKTTKEGVYKFSNLHTNKYKVYALDDENGNYLFDKGERIAFTNDSIILNNNIKLSELYLFKEKEENLKVIDFGNKQVNKFYLAFNAPVDSLVITQLLNGTRVPFNRNLKITDSRDSAYFWINQSADSLKIITEIWGENYTSDTLLININIDKRDVREKPPEKLSIRPRINLYTTGKIDIEFNEPVIKMDQSLVLFYSDTNRIKQIPEIRFTDSSYTVCRIDFEYDEGKNYRIIFKSGAFTGFDSITNDSTVVLVRTLKETDLGIISINVGIERTDIPVIVQLLDDKYKPVRENILNKTTKITYNNLQPGKYYIRCILDENKNNKWDTGNFLKKRQPEQIIYYSEEISLKANWELNDLKIKIQ